MTSKVGGGVLMTYYYYIAADRPIKFSEGQLDAWPVDDEMNNYIKGFDFPIQFEMFSPEKEKELLPLFSCLKYHFEREPTSTVQIANYLSSNIEDCTIDKKKSIPLKVLTHPKQLALEVGELLTIKN